MLMIDKAILDISCVIDKNISRFDSRDRGLLSQNILAQLRNFVEYIAEKIYANGKDIEPNDYGMKQESLKYIQLRGEFRFLRRFHDLLQKSVSHYTLDEGGSERLMLKYYEYLLKIKILLRDKYKLEVLENIEKFPLNTDTELTDYYKKIADKICHPTNNCVRSTYTDKYYIQKIKPFFINQHIYYEVTFTTANDKASKFDRVIAFTKIELMENYSVKLSLYNDNIQILGKSMNIQIIDRWEVSIRTCELDNFADLFGTHPQINSGTKEYRALMQFITHTKMNLTELVEGAEDYYEFVKSKIAEQARVMHFFDILDRCRLLVLQNQPGCNVIRYLLYKLNNRIIKNQYRRENCKNLTNLNLKYGCIPFDQMPYNSSLNNHNPRIFDLLECIPANRREHEFLARFIRNNIEINGNLFTSKNDIVGFDDIEGVIQRYNEKLYYRHKHREIKCLNNQVYISGYTEDSEYIIQRIKALSKTGIDQYTGSVNSWLKKSGYVIDSEEKREALQKMFSESQVALIYGSAGTGKSTLISHVSNFFADRKKLYLANTNPAVDNMRRRVKIGSSDYKTIASFLSSRETIAECDVLFIDECSTVSNSDMRNILEKANFKLLVLVGDIYQIEAISFGNWFSIIKSFIASTSIFELKKPYRSTNEKLLLVWERVRNLNIDILEPMVKNEYSAKLDESIFEESEKDQIILCLNYDGLYGINNLNRFLQGNNPNKEVHWGINFYKVGDPILFNESNRFSPLIYNNMKGKIINIHPEDLRIWFEIELDISINAWDAGSYDFELMEPAENGNSIIRFSVNKHRSTDNDDDFSDIVIPFQIAYAVSIHKAQGLEYDSVKIVITNEVEERITHNIFYTAITRAKKNLKIYWSPETENKILGDMKFNNNNKDVELLKLKYPQLNS